jgi:hypothetical protein
MRVATLFTGFTGAAACAAAFTPAAGAQAASVSPVHQPRPYQAHLNTMGPDEITQGNCLGANQSHWLHLVTSQSITCYGDRGLTGVGTYPGLKIYSFCGGNNSGWFWFAGEREMRFQVGTYYYEPAGAPFLASAVSISTWHGNDKCSY